MGSEVVAVVEMVPGAPPDEADLTAHAGNSVARLQAAEGVVFVEKIHRSPAGRAGTTSSPATRRGVRRAELTATSGGRARRAGGWAEQLAAESAG